MEVGWEIGKKKGSTKGEESLEVNIITVHFLHYEM